MENLQYNGNCDDPEVIELKLKVKKLLEERPENDKVLTIINSILFTSL